MVADPPKTRRPHSRRLRFTLRLLLGLVTLLCIGLGVWTHRAREQRRIVEKIERSGGIADYDYLRVRDGSIIDHSPLPPWLINLLGQDFFHNVTSVGVHKTKDLVRALARLPRLQSVMIKVSELDDDDLEPVTYLGGVQTLVIHRDHHAQNR